MWLRLTTSAEKKLWQALITCIRVKKILSSDTVNLERVWNDFWSQF